MRAFLLCILILNWSLSSQSWDESDFFPVLPGLENSFEEARQLDSLSGWEEKIANDFYSISNSWNEIVVHNILEYVNSFQFSDFVHETEIYKQEFLNYIFSLKESIYVSWKEEIYEKIIEERFSFYDSLHREEISNYEYYEVHPDFYKAIDSLASQKEELLSNIEEINIIYDNKQLEIEKMEFQVRDTIRITLDSLREDLIRNNLYYDLNEKGERIKIKDENSLLIDSLNTSGKELENLLNNLDKQLKENKGLEDISKELETYLYEESLQAAAIQTDWKDKINLNFSNSKSTWIRTISYDNNPDAYTESVWVKAIIQYRNGNKNSLSNLIEKNIIPDVNTTLNKITNVDMIASTKDPVMKWNSNAADPLSNVGGRYSVYGDDFKYYTNHTIVCWGLACIYHDIQRREETISIQLDFSAIDQNAKKNSEIWNAFSLQLDSASNHWKISLIPAIQIWETKKNDFLVLQENWRLESANLQEKILLEYTQKMQSLTANLRETKSLQTIEIDSFQKSLDFKTKILNLNMDSLSKISENFESSLLGLQTLGLYSKLNEDLLSSKREIMENLRASYSSEKILTGEVDSKILEKFQDSGICSGENFQKNSQECTGYIEKYGSNKYSSVELDTNDNLIFTKRIYSGDYITTGRDKSNFTNYKILEEERSFSITGISNFKLSDKESIDLFSKNALTHLYSDFETYFEGLSSFKNTSIEPLVTQYNKELDTYSINQYNHSLTSIQKEIAKYGLIKDFATSLLTGGTVKSWLKTTLLTKTAEVLGNQWNINPQLLLSYHNHIQNKHNLQNRESKITGGFIPKELAVPIGGLLTNTLAELRRLFSNIYIEAAGNFESDDTKKKWKQDQDLADKQIRMTEYNQAVASMDYQSQYKADLKSFLYDEVSKHVFQNTSIDPNLISQLVQYLDKKKADQKREKAEQNQKIITLLQVVTAVLFPPSAGATLSTLAAQIGSAAAQAAIASSSGDSRTTLTTFSTALAGSILGSLPLPINSGSTVSNLLNGTTRLGLGVSLSYTPESSITSLGDVFDNGLYGENPSGWSGGVHLGAKGFHVGIGSSSEGNTINFGGGLGENTFVDLSSNTSNGNLGLTLGQGSRFGTSAGIVFNSVLPSSLFASYNPDIGNPLGIGATVSLSAGGGVQVGMDLGKAEAFSSTFSSSSGWSNLQANVDYQSELNSQYAVEMNQESGGTNSDDSDTTVPLLALYGLLGILGIRRRKESSMSNSSDEDPILFVLPTNLDSTIPPTKDPSKNSDPDASLNLLAQLLQIKPQPNTQTKGLPPSSEPEIRPLKVQLETSLNQIANLSHDEPGRALQNSKLGSLMCNETVLAGILQSLGVTKNDILYKIMSLQTTKQISLVQNGKTVAYDLVLQDTSGNNLFNPKLEKVPMADILEVFRLEMKKKYFLDKYDKNINNLQSNQNKTIEQVQLYGGSKMEIIKVGDQQYKKFEVINIDKFTRKDIETLIGIFDEPGGKQNERAKKWDRENSETLNLLAKELNIQPGSIKQNHITFNNLTQIQNILNGGGKILSLGDFAFDSNNGKIKRDGHFVEVTQVTEKGITLNNPYGYYDTKTLKWNINKENIVFGQNNFYTWEEAKTMNLRVSSFYKNRISN
jgi:hypothetical protein